MSQPAIIASPPRRLRQGNEMAALRALHRFGRLSRADLARKLGLNRSSSGHIVAALTADGLVREVMEEPGERTGHARAGRPGILLELQPDAVFFAGVEIGVEHISFVAADLSARPLASRTEPFDAPTAGLEATFAAAARLADAALGPGDWGRCEGFGIAIPAQMDRDGRVRLAPLLGWRDIYPAAIMRRHLALPPGVALVAENDANAFAIGDAYGREVARPGVTLALVMETGVGGGIVVDGVLFRGGHGLAGEIGHLSVPDGAGGQRRLEELVGLDGVLPAFRAASGDLGAGFDAFLSEVQDRAPRAVAIAEGWASALAFGLSQACRIVDPDQIVLGGSLAALYPLVGARVAAHWAGRQDASFPCPDILVNESPAFGAAFGAACILHQGFLSADADPPPHVPRAG